MSRPVTVVVSEPSAKVVVSDGGATAVVTAPAPVLLVDPGRRGPAGPVGPQGPPGLPGDSSAVRGYTHTQNVPAQLVQVLHSLPFEPGGIHCEDFTGQWCEPDRVAYPQVGVMEVLFGSPFSGIIRIS